MVKTTSLEPTNSQWTEQVVLGSRLLHTDERLAAISLENHLAAQFWSQGTCWCIGEPSMFHDYRRTGKLILFRLFKENRRYLFSPSWLEFRNSRQRSLSLMAFIARFPSIEATIRTVVRGDWRARLSFGLCAPNEYFDHSLNLANSKIRSLPDGLVVRDDLALRHNPISKLPDNLFVGGDLDIRNTGIIAIPPDAKIAGNILG
jgi:hypothetical protein